MALPPLVRDDDNLYLIGHVEVPWYRTDDPAGLTVMNCEDDQGQCATEASPAQVAAFERVVVAGADLRGPILQQFREYVSELETADWTGLEAFFRLSCVRLLPVEKDGLGYVGLVFSCLQFDYGYEHGAGIVLHGDRIVSFGVAEEAETGEEAYIDAGFLPAEDEDEILGD